MPDRLYLRPEIITDKLPYEHTDIVEAGKKSSINSRTDVMENLTEDANTLTDPVATIMISASSSQPSVNRIPVLINRSISPPDLILILPSIIC